MLGSIPTFPERPEFPGRASGRGPGPDRKRHVPAGPAALAAAALSAAFLLGAALPASAQTRRCDLVGRDTLISGVPMKQCLDLAALRNQTITVPSNVTRIDNDGLSLCNSSITSGGDADIVYVYDNSGSMGRSRVWIGDADAIPGPDTLFYHSTANCSTTATIPNGSINIQVWNAEGTAQSTVSVPRLVSNARCDQYSGDPYNSRGRAFRLGLANQAARAPQSGAGIMAFIGRSVADGPSVTQVGSPRIMSAANLAILQDTIAAYSNGGTNYRAPLDTAKRWLTTSATSNPRKAIIFLSDGAPNSNLTNGYCDNPNRPGADNEICDYMSLVDANMPPIYGIFLGRDTVQTGKLRELSQMTNGRFYLIPPNRPDSLIAVVDRILDVVLKNYAPNTAIVTNITRGQSANSAAPTGFSQQPNGAWLMRLNDIVALSPQAQNQIRVAAQYREVNDGTLQNDTITFTIATTGTPATSSGTITTQFSRTCYAPSALRFLRADNSRPPAYTEADSAYQLRLRTGSNALTATTADARSRSLGDVETPSLALQATTADSSVFRVIPSFRVAATATSGNGTLQASQFDTLFAAWSHPRDSQDVARDTMLVRAANVSARAWFALTEGGTAVTTYPTSQRTAHIVIEDQAADPDRIYSAMISTNQPGSDSERVSLRVRSPGILVGQLPINSNSRVRQDGTIQVSILGDQIRVEYRDPIYGESAVGTVGYDQEVQESASITFVDEDGNPLDSSAIWSPAKGKLYVRYEDDRVGGTMAAKTLSLSLASKRYGTILGVDDERFSISLVAGSSGTRATWTGSIDLADAFPAVDSNGRAETRYRGEATVTAFTHDNAGNQQTATVADFLVIAYPDSQAVLTWSLADTANVPAGSEGLIIGVKDQDFTNGTNDSVAVTLVCTRSLDSVSGVSARELASGSYRTSAVVKDGAPPSLNDRVLSCLSADQILVRYVDPVYGTSTQLVVNEVAKPAANPPGRPFLVEEFVTLQSATPGAIIYYTVDGTTPVAGTGSVYTGPIQIAGTTTLKAIAAVPGWKDSKVMVETYTKEAVASRLEILDENGNRIPGGTLTGSSTQVRFKLTTTQANLPPPNVSATTRVGQDEEAVILATTVSLGSSLEYWQNSRLNHNNGVRTGNDTLDSRNTDTLIAIWINPFNANDVARDTLVIRPAFKVSEVYFTEVPNGPRVTSYADSQSVVHVVVKTIPQDPSLVYRVTVSATELGLDDEVLTLAQVAPGVFTAQVPVARGAKAPDVPGTLQVSAGADQLTAVFVDPVFGGEYRGNAGFGQEVEESAALTFVRGDGSPVAPDEIWNPDSGKVYLRYSDDWLAGIDSLVRVRTAKVSLVNRRSGASVGTDEEDVTLTLVSQTATRGTWEGEVQLRDRAAATPQNDTLETYFRGEATASITPHSNQGVIGGTPATDAMVIAYPDRPADIVIRDTAGRAVDRVTSAVDITVRDQQHTKTGDKSITVSVACAGTGDRLQAVRLVWDGSAFVAAPPIRKGEAQDGQTVSAADSLLQCLADDRITVTYVDPVYSETRTGDAAWTDRKPSRIWFASVRDSSVITSVADGVDNSFLVFVEGVSPSRDRADTIQVTLTTLQGERLVVRAVETGAMTGVFRAEVDYVFITRAPDRNNQVLEADINRDERNNRVLVTAQATLGGTAVKADLALFSAYNMVVKGWIKDVDGDGRADRAYFLFDKKLARLPASLEEVAWNEEGERFRQKAGASMLSFLDADSTVVVADFSRSPFGAGLTGIPDGRRPYALFPSDNLFGGQSFAPLADSVGPVPLTAVKRPSNLNSYDVSATEKRFYPDTLILTVSEGLRTSTTFSDMARFSKGCAPYSESLPLKLDRQPQRSRDNALEWTLIVDNSPTAQIPLVGDCIFLEADGRLTDLNDNRPSPLGVKLEGENPRQVIRDFRGFPPVAGMEPGSAGFVLVTNDSRKGSSSEGRWSTSSGGGNVQVIWVPPVGLDECAKATDVMKCLEKKVPDRYDVKATPMREIESQTITSMPVKDFSAVQVIATGRYIARVSIYDNLGVHVRSFVQAFGFWGEEKNPWRATEKGLRSFLIWDMKDKNQAPVGQGVYVWKVNFAFSDKKSEVMYTRTGVLRN